MDKMGEKHAHDMAPLIAVRPSREPQAKGHLARAEAGPGRSESREGSG